MPLLSVIVPVYNEAKTVRQILEKINSIAIDKEIIVVDDGSFDGTGALLRDIRLDNLKIIHHGTNRGKGSAVLTGLANAAGDYVIIQDADLEYDPNDYLKLIECMKKNYADLVLGARFMKGYKGLLVHKLGNRLLTIFMNFLFQLKLNDCFTGYKLLRRQAINILGLRSCGFDIEIEIIAKAVNNKLRIAEEYVSYHPRSYTEGKKIRCKDGLMAAISILKYRFMR